MNFQHWYGRFDRRQPWHARDIPFAEEAEGPSAAAVFGAVAVFFIACFVLALLR